MSTCSVYTWCEEDHSLPDTPANEHTQQVQVTAGTHTEEIWLELVDGEPRMTWYCGGYEFWTDAETGTKSFEDMREVIDQILQTYAAFQSQHKMRLKRPREVDQQLAEVEN